MRRLIVLAMVMIFLTISISGAFGETEKEEYLSFAKGTFEVADLGEYVQVRVGKDSGCFAIANPESPSLPTRETTFLVDTRTSDVTVDVTGVYYEQKVLKPVYPAQYPVIMGSESSFTEGSKEIYSTDAFYPKTLNTKPVLASTGGIRTVGFLVYPVQYNPVKGILRIYTSLRVRISCSESGEKLHAPQIGFEKVKKRVLSRVVNPEDEELYMPVLDGLMPRNPGKAVFSDDERNAFDDTRMGGSAQLANNLINPTSAPSSYVHTLIVTSSTLSSSFATLIAARNKQGRPMAVETTSSIYANYTGIDNQAKIRACILDYYTNSSTQSVLLGGDDTIVPDRDCYISVPLTSSTLTYTDMPTDYYYACLNGTWDGDGDGIYGELADSVDYTPEVNVARAAVRTAAEVTALCNKVLGYEVTPPTSNFGKNILFAGDQLWSTGVGSALTPSYTYNPSDAEVKGDSIYANTIGTYWAHQSTNPADKFYDTFTSWDTTTNGDYPLSTANFSSKYNSGNYNFMLMTTHGNKNVWAMEVSPNYVTSNASAQTNAARGVIYTIACLTNAFDDATYDPCLSEGFIRNSSGGAAAYIGCSREGLGSSDFTVNSFLSEGFAEMFFDEVFQYQDETIGEAVSNMKYSYNTYATTYDVVRYHLYGLNLLGDPAMTLLTSDPSAMSVTHNSSLGTGSHTVTVNTGVPYSYVCLSKGSEVYLYGTSDSTGVYSATVVPTSNGVIDVTVTATNHLQYSGKIYVNDAPTISGVNSSYAVFEAGAVSFAVTATDPNPGDTITITNSTLPSSASFNPATGAFSWTPGYTDSGVYTVTFTASDNFASQQTGATNGSTQATVTLYISNVNRDPVINNTTLTFSLNENQQLQVPVNVTDVDSDDTLTINPGTLPTNASFDSSTNIILFTPDFTQAGVHTFVVTATDDASNKFGSYANGTDSVTFTVNVQNVNRQPSIDNSLLTFTVNENQTQQIPIIVSDPDTDDTFTINPGTLPTNASFDSSTQTITFSPDYTQAGVFTFQVSVTDNASNKLGSTSNGTDSAMFTVNVQNVNRQPSIDNTTFSFTVNENELLQVPIIVTDPDTDDTLNISVLSLPTGASFDRQTMTVTFTPDFTQAGIDTFTVTVTDNAVYKLGSTANGTDTETFTIDIQNVNRPPVIDTTTTLFTGEEGSQITVPIIVSDLDVDDSKMGSTGQLPNGASWDSDTFTVSWTPTTLQAGTYEFTVYVSDDASMKNGTTTNGVDSATFTIVVNNLNSPPVITNTQTSGSVDEGGTWTFQTTATDGDSDDTLTYGVSTTLPVASFDPATGAITVAPSKTDAGIHTVTLTVTDDASTKTGSTANGTDFFQYTLTVNNVNDAPVIENSRDTFSIAEDDPFTLTIESSDPNPDDTLTLSLSNEPDGMLLNTGTGEITWTPGFLQAGEYQVTVTVTDDASSKQGSTTNGTDTFTFTVNVDDTNRPPVITDIENKIVNEEEELTFTVSINDPDTDNTLTTSAENLPTGAIYDPLTMTFSWTPTKAQDGVHEDITIKVSDGIAEEHTTFTINVNDPNPPVVIESGSYDDDRDGNIDRVELKFDETVSDTTGVATPLDSFSVGGVTPKGVSWGSSDTLVLSFDDQVSGTGIKTLSYTPPETGGIVDSVGNPLACIEDLSITDKAAPQVSNVEVKDDLGTGNASSYEFKFSEPLDTSSTNKVGWKIFDSTGVKEMSGDATLTLIFDDTLQFSNLNGGSGILIYYEYVGQDLKDPSGNVAKFSVNDRPVVDSDEQQEVTPSLVRLNVESTDGQQASETLSYEWNKVSGPSLVDSRDFQSSEAFALLREAGVYVFEGTVTDAFGAIAKKEVTVTVQNVPPVPVFHHNIFVDLNSGVQPELDASQSYDPNGEMLSYVWSAPEIVNIHSVSSPITEFNPTSVGVFDAILYLYDSQNNEAVHEFKIIVSSNDNKMPLADAGPDLQGVVGRPITLDGSGSSDGDGDPLTYSWMNIGTEFAYVNNPGEKIASFTPTGAGVYYFQLNVSDGKNAGLPDTLMVTVFSNPEDGNNPPKANAGADMTVPLAPQIQLDGTASVDADGDTLTYEWEVISGPMQLSEPNSATPTFVPSGPCSGFFKLTVSDGENTSVPSFLSVVVTDDTSEPVVDVNAFHTMPKFSVQTTISIYSNAVDAESDALIFWWEQQSGPLLTIDQTLENLFITPALAGTYRFVCYVSDGIYVVSDEVTVQVDDELHVQPVASVMADKVGYIDNSVSLKYSTDEWVGDYCQWVQISGPGAVVEDYYAYKTEFVPTVAGEYIFALYAKTDTAISDPAYVTVTVLDQEPPSGGGGCFVATAAFGSFVSDELVKLCSFRDSALQVSCTSSALVELYYCTSPDVAAGLRESSALRSIMRRFLR